MKKDYLEALRKKLKFLSKEEIDIIVEEYDSYIKKKQKTKTIKEVLNDLGDVDTIASNIKFDYEENTTNTFLNKITAKIIKFLKDTILLFSDKRQKPLTKLLVEIILIILTLLIVSIPFTIVTRLGLSVLSTIPFTIEKYFVFIWNLYMQFSYLIVSILIFYIFTNNYIKSIKDSKVFLPGLDKIQNINTKEELLIKEVLTKTLIFIKGIIQVLFVPLIFILIVLLILFVVLLILMFKNIFFISIIILLISITLFDISVINYLHCFLNKKANSYYPSLFITSLVLFIFGTFYFGVELKAYNYNNTLTTNINTKTLTYTFNINKDDIYEIGGKKANIKVISNSELDDQIKVRITYYSDLTNVGYSFLEAGKTNNNKYLSIETLLKKNNKYYKYLWDELSKDLKNRQLDNYEKLLESTIEIEVPTKYLDSIKFDQGKTHTQVAGEVHYD